MNKPMLSLLLMLGASPAWAQEPFIEGVYLPTVESCAQARTGGLDSALEDGSLALSASGLHGYEYHCDFLQVLKGVRTPGWTVVALCEEPDFAFSDLITVMRRQEGRLELVSLALRPGSEEGEESPGGLEHYVLCEGVEPP